MVDPDGDLPFLAVLGIGALVGTITNGVNNVSNGQAFFQGAGKAAMWGAVGAAVSFGIGSAASGLGSGLGKAAFQMGAHGYTGGLRSELMGGDFGSGFLSGALSSGMSSGASSLGIKNLGMVGIGGLSGGIGSSIGGGNFWDGIGQGLLTSGLNHAAHVAATSIESGIHVRAVRAFLEDSGYDPAQVAQDVVKQTDGFFGKYYAMLKNEKNYISNWESQWDSQTGKPAFVSPVRHISERGAYPTSGVSYSSKIGYRLKFYSGRSNSIGLIRGNGHFIEAGLEFIDGTIRNLTGIDNAFYNMHYINSSNYLKFR